MFKVTKEIYDTLTDAGLSASVEEADGCSMVCVKFPLKYSAPIAIHFMSRDDDNDVAVRVDLMRVEKSDMDVVLPLINGFNSEYRHLKFTLHDENSVFIEYDMLNATECVGECAKEMVARIIKTICDAHPKLLYAIVARETAGRLS